MVGLLHPLRGGMCDDIWTYDFKTKKTEQLVVVAEQYLFQKHAKIENDCKVEIIDSDMSGTDQDRSLRIILRSVLETNFSSENNYDIEMKACVAVAKNIKMNMDNIFRKASPWQVVVGLDYGTFVTHENKFFLFLKIGKYWVTVFLSN